MMLVVNIALWRSELMLMVGRRCGWTWVAPGTGFWMVSIGWLAVSWWPGRYLRGWLTVALIKPGDI